MLTTWLCKRKRSLIASGVVLALAVSPPADASMLWDWSYTGAGIAASGTFTTDNSPDGAGYYELTGIFGSRNGLAITGLVPAGTAIPGNAGYPVDNLINASGLLTAAGFGYETADGTYANPYYANFLPVPGFYEVFTDPGTGGFSELPVQFSAIQVPEPATLGLLLAGLGGLVTVARTRHPLGRAILTLRAKQPSP
jgi:hypothetical protein